MKTTTFTLFSVCLCSLASAEGRDGSAKWFSDSVSLLAPKKWAADESFNGTWSSDERIVTRANPVEEILSECLKVRPQQRFIGDGWSASILNFWLFCPPIPDKT